MEHNIKDLLAQTIVGQHVSFSELDAKAAEGSTDALYAMSVILDMKTRYLP